MSSTKDVVDATRFAASMKWRRRFENRRILAPNEICKLCLSMAAELNTAGGALPAKRTRLNDIRSAVQQILAGVELSLNFLFSGVVVIVATLLTAWLGARLGIYPPTESGAAWKMVGGLSLATILAGFYIHLCLLDRNWLLLAAVTGATLAAVWCGGGRSLAWIPLLLLGGGGLATSCARRWNRSRLKLATEEGRVPRIARQCGSLLTKLATGAAAPLIVVSLAVAAMSGLAKHEFENRLAPDVVFELANGDSWHLDDQRGKVVVIDFWAPWCGPCRAAMPNMKAIYAKYASRDDFLLVGASEESDRTSVADFCRKNGMPWLQLFVPQNPVVDGVHPDRLTRPGIPSVWVIDRNGAVVGADLRNSAVTVTIDRVMRGQEDAGLEQTPALPSGSRFALPQTDLAAIARPSLLRGALPSP